jgi:hypothetical protein
MYPVTELFESTEIIRLGFFFFFLWMKGEVDKINVDTPHALLARISNSVASIEENEHNLRRKTRDLCTKVAKCFKVDNEIF